MPARAWGEEGVGAVGVGGVIGGALGDAESFGAQAILGAIGQWVADGAAWLLDAVGQALSSTTQVDVGAGWFTTNYQIMTALAAAVLLPVLLFAVIQAVYRQSASQLVRTVIVHVPLALLLTGVAVKLVQLGLALVDSLSTWVATGAGLDTHHLLSSVSSVLVDPAANGVAPSVPTFVVLLGALAVVAGAFTLWLELLIRSVAVYTAVLFLPLALASLAWPAIAHWCRRLVDTLVALVLSKFVIVAVLALAVSALSAGPAQPDGIANVLGGAALLLLAAFSPWALLRMVPMVEAGAVGHLEQVRRQAQQAVTGPTKNLAALALAGAGGGEAAAAAVGTEAPAGASVMALDGMARSVTAFHSELASPSGEVSGGPDPAAGGTAGSASAASAPEGSTSSLAEPVSSNVPQGARPDSAVSTTGAASGRGTGGDTAGSPVRPSGSKQLHVLDSDAVGPVLRSLGSADDAPPDDGR